MKSLVLFVLVCVAAWMAWHHWPELFEKHPHHDIQLVNAGSSSITRMRVTVGGQTFVKEVLAPGASTTWSFEVQDDSDFRLVWELADKMGEHQWSGGRVTKGPIVQHHTLTIDRDGGVVYTFEDKHEERRAARGSSP